MSSLLECHLQTLSLTTEGAVTEQGEGEGEDMLSYDHLSHDQVIKNYSFWLQKQPKKL